MDFLLIMEKTPFINIVVYLNVIHYIYAINFFRKIIKNNINKRY